MLQKLKAKWGVSWLQFTLIFTTFALGGSGCGWLGRQVLQVLDIESAAIRIPLYIIIVTLLWPLCVLVISIPLGQFRFFKNYISRIGRKMAGKKDA